MRSTGGPSSHGSASRSCSTLGRLAAKNRPARAAASKPGATLRVNPRPSACHATIAAPRRPGSAGAGVNPNSKRGTRRHSDRLNAEPLIEIDHVTFGYDASRTILDDISLAFARGKVTAILGGSGCGKTTLLRLIGGMATANAGRVRLRRRPIDAARPPAAAAPAPPHGHAVPVRRTVHRPDACSTTSPSRCASTRVCRSR